MIGHNQNKFRWVYCLCCSGFCILEHHEYGHEQILFAQEIF
jgi:hypothetical protein